MAHFLHVEDSASLRRLLQIACQSLSDRIVANWCPLLVDWICLSGPYRRVPRGHMTECVAHEDFAESARISASLAGDVSGRFSWNAWRTASIVSFRYCVSTPSDVRLFRSR
jgi:hypothetical protein